VDVRQHVYDEIAHHLGYPADQISDESLLCDELGADSLDIVELVMNFEEMFQIEIPDSDLENMTTVGKVVELIQEKAGSNMTEEQTDAGREPNEHETTDAPPQRTPEDRPLADDGQGDADEGEGDQAEADQEDEASEED
jgi:acyl carrier protein